MIADTRRSVTALSSDLLLQRFDLRIAKTEMMRDFVHKHVAHEIEQIHPGLDPFEQNGLAKEKDLRGLASNVADTSLR